MNWRLTLLACTLTASNVCSAEDLPPPVSFGPGLLQATLGLCVVLALIWGAARLARRFSPTGSTSRSPIKLLASLALGQRERVVLIEFGEEWFLLGVSAGQVSTLGKVPKSTQPQNSTPDAMPFAKLLAMATRKKET